VMVTLLLGAYENTLVSSVPAYRLPFEIFVGGIMLNGASWLISFILSFFICQLENNQSITVCVECANPNVGLAIAIILLTMKKEDADIAVGVPMFYGVLTAVMIFIIGSLFRLCGFIQDEDDDINHKYANSGWTKISECWAGHHDIKTDHSLSDLDESNHINDGGNEDTNNGQKLHHRHVNSTSLSIQFPKSMDGGNVIEEIEMTTKQPLKQTQKMQNNTNDTLRISSNNEVMVIKTKKETPTTPLNEDHSNA